MKKILLLFCIFGAIHIVSFAQVEKEISASIKKVTVFTSGAQIDMEASVPILQGPMILKLTGLSPYIKPESVRVDGDGAFTILNVQHQTDYTKELERNKQIEALQAKVEALNLKVEDENMWIKVLNQKIEFLNVNKDIAGKEQVIPTETFKTLHEYYGTSIETLSFEVLKRQRDVNELNKNINKLNQQLSALNSKAELPGGVILISIDAKQNKTSKLKCSYVVKNASWFPSYDIRFGGIGNPLTITHKANITQNTGIDWKDVDLVLSTAQTNVSAQIPKLGIFFLGYANQYSKPGLMKMSVVDGDFDMKSEEMTELSADNSFGYSQPSAITVKNETTNEYVINVPQTVLSNNTTTTIQYREAKIDASFEYQSVPKLSAHVFLIGKIHDWYKAELLDGDANIYLENSYVGKSYINTQELSDTLELSFGVDNNISVKREKISDFTTRQFIGPNKKESVGYKITVRNNKSYAVSTTITDQIPVSTLKEIEVETLELSGGVLDASTGFIEWNISLNPNETKELQLKYSVKYPKDKKVVFE
ncbi:MAG: DUF4139 domain-containing protein [Bacteroidales bacterium]|nr:DUF4139 domain-containing protein [Bacteroidales bacterium]